MSTQPDRYRLSLRTGKNPHARPWGNGAILLLIVFLSLHQTLVIARPTPWIPPTFIPQPIWTRKPVLGYFVFTASLVKRLPGEVGLTTSQFKAIEQVALREDHYLQELALQSQPIIQNPDLSLEQKRALIAQMDYNGQVKQIIHESRQNLIFSLGPYPFTRLSRWIERQWQVERLLHGSLRPPYSPRTFRIFATRYDSGGAYTVALPDKCLKFANGGNSICNEDGYIAGYGYSVFISYVKSTAASVNESGPWNVDDNYWARSNDPTPRRMFADLALGMPEAQAAYFDGYNGGVDQFGRVVTAPFGIDLARQVSIDIGLEPGKNDWIDVSFMWTDGWDGAPASDPASSGGTAAPAATLATIFPIEIAAANPDGSVVHVVQEGQTLWNIAAAYQVDINQVLALNGMVDGSIIVPGQELWIKPASLTTTPTKIASPATTQSTETPPPRRSPTPPPATAVAQLVATPQPTGNPDTPAPTGKSPSNEGALSTSDDRILTGIGALGAIGLLLVILGQWLRRRS